MWHFSTESVWAHAGPYFFVCTFRYHSQYIGISNVGITLCKENDRHEKMYWIGIVLQTSTVMLCRGFWWFNRRETMD